MDRAVASSSAVGPGGWLLRLATDPMVDSRNHACRPVQAFSALGLASCENYVLDSREQRFTSAALQVVSAQPPRRLRRGGVVKEQDRVFVGGAWSAPTGDVLEVISPHTEEAIATFAAAGPDDVDRAVAAARAGLRRRALAPARPGRADRRCPPPRRRSTPSAARTWPSSSPPRWARRSRSRSSRRRRLPMMLHERLRRHRHRLRLGGGAPGTLRRGHHRPQGADRRRRRDRAVEHAAVPDRREAGARRCWPAARS